MQHNQRIAELAAQLPLQRRQLAGQTIALTQALRRNLSSPTALAVAAVAGGVLGWRWFRPAQCPEQNNEHSATVPLPVIDSLLRQSLSAAVMAYLARSLA